VLENPWVDITTILFLLKELLQFDGCATYIVDKFPSEIYGVSTRSNVKGILTKGKSATADVFWKLLILNSLTARPFPALSFLSFQGEKQGMETRMRELVDTVSFSNICVKQIYDG